MKTTWLLGAALLISAQTAFAQSGKAKRNSKKAENTKTECSANEKKQKECTKIECSKPECTDAKSSKSECSKSECNKSECSKPKGNVILNRARLYAGPDSISKFYRIPGIVTLADGTICTVADRRLNHNGDLPADIDVVFRKSTDGGKTWTPVKTVIEHVGNDGKGGYGDPALGIDPKSGDLVIVCTHGNGLWNSTPDNHASIVVTRSSDKGETWSEPVDITASLFDPQAGKAPVKCITAFASSGLLSSRRDGTLQFVLVCREEGQGSPLAVHYCYSSDGGHTWTASPNTPDHDGDESKVVELKDGTLLMSIRNRRQGHRKFSRSTDGGITWSPYVIAETLPDPAINGDIIAIDRNGKEILLHSICDNQKSRENVSLFASSDAGKTWQKLISICPEGSSYSTLSMTGNGTLAALVEENAPEGGLHLWLTEIDIDKLLKQHGL